MKTVEIYTDGACSNNPGDGGWAAVLMFGGVEKTLSGGQKSTTNNQMELVAVIEGLKALKEPCIVNLYSDSAYVVNAFTQDWITQWQLSGWKTSTKKEVKNIELWKALLELCQKHKVNFIKVKGHADNKYNNKCDELARAEILKLSKVV